MFPALAAVVLGTTVFAFILLSPFGAQQNVAQTGLGALFFASNLVIYEVTGGYFSPAAQFNPLLHTWSLAVEWQFYLGFALVLVATFHKRLNFGLRLSPVTAVASIGVISIGLNGLAWAGFTFPGSSFLLGFYSPLTRAWEFAAGALLALMPVAKLPSKRIMEFLIILGLGLMAVAVLFEMPERFASWGPVVLAVLGSALVIFSGSAAQLRASRFLTSGPCVKLGDWSYSVYLWHWPFIVFASELFPGNLFTGIVATLISIVPAICFYYLLEKPLSGVKGSRQRRPGAISTLGFLLTVPTLASAALWQSANMKASSPKFLSFTTAIQTQHQAWRCLDFATLTQRPGPSLEWSDCHFGEDHEGPPIYLVGDSNAGQYGEGVIEAAKQLERSTVIRTAAGCPFAGVERIHPDPEYAEANSRCSGYVAETLDYLLTAPVGTVVIANSDAYFLEERWFLGTEDDGRTNSESDKAVLLEIGFGELLGELSSAGHQVVVIQPLPRFTSPPYDWEPSRCLVREVLEDGCQVEMPEEFLEDLQDNVRQVIARVVDSHGGLTMDFRRLVCVEKVCSPSRKNHTVYMDPTHISVSTSRDLADVFASTFRSLTSDPTSGREEDLW